LEQFSIDSKNENFKRKNGVYINNGRLSDIIPENKTPSADKRKNIGIIRISMRTTLSKNGQMNLSTRKVLLSLSLRYIDTLSAEK
jgi:hypothetical protein